MLQRRITRILYAKTRYFMNPYIDSGPPIVDSGAFRAEIIRAVRRGLERAQPGALLRVQLPLPRLDPLAWLRAHGAHSQYYWSDRRDAFTMAGVGECDVLASHPHEAYSLEQVFAQMRTRLLNAPPSLRYYGGLRFHPGESRTTLWKPFRDFRFIVPRFEVVRNGDSTVFACNLYPDAFNNADEAILQTSDHLHAIEFAEAIDPVSLPAIRRRIDTPSKRGWHDAVVETLGAFEESVLKKVVLARETQLQMDGPLDPVALLTQLVARSVNAFDFCFHPAPNRAFIGSSPERLYKRVESYVQSEAIAGTRPRGKSDAEDQRLAQELMRSAKDQSEHAFVVDMLREHFDRFCRCVHVEEGPDILQLRHCQHLRTRVEGLLHDADSDAALLKALHPTPAVGGVPREMALRWIEEHEAFDRGIYAAPVGWVGADAAEFCVGIRSGLISRDILALYAGAGIVPGSDPTEEWEEVENKMANFMSVLPGHVD
jgi:menaquinone-specific isochorismate synthase